LREPLPQAPVPAAMPHRRAALRVVAGREASGGPAGARRKAPAVAAPGATQRIVASITQAIVARRLMPGTKLAEQKIADVFKVSRTLVRQALHQLSRDRLVTLEPARGAFVAMPSEEEARQVLELRQMIEAAMVKRLCSVISPQQIASLRAHLKAEQAALARAETPGRTRLPGDFYVLMAQMLGNQVLAQLLGDLLSRASLISLRVPASHSAESAMAEHAAIVDALERRDARTAVRLAEGQRGPVERQRRLDPRAPDLAQILGMP
jgi:DNA-binding GntR family transcriptional regulator